MNTEEHTPRYVFASSKEGLELVIAENLKVLTLINNAIHPFSLAAQGTSASSPAFSRIASIFLKKCQKEFTEITTMLDEIIAMLQQENLQVSKALKKHELITSNALKLIDTLAIHEGRNQGDILHDFAESFITYVEYGYLPVAESIAESDKEIAIILMKTVQDKLEKCYPGIHEAYPPQHMPNTEQNTANIQEILAGNLNIFQKADHLAKLISSNNYALLQSIAGKKAA